MRLALVSLAALALAGPAFAGQAVSLRNQPSAGAAGVTLGDLFDGATGAASKVVVAPRPADGLNAVLEAGKVQVAARAAGLDWDNPLGMRRIIVSAAPAAAIKATTQAGGGAARPQVLAYARNLAAGEIVGPNDLVWSDQAVGGPDAAGDADVVIGMAARRPLRMGAAVQTRDVSAPVVVHRDETISVAFNAGGISLVLQAKALKDAAVGEAVQVMNLQSKKIIEAVVAGPGRALVGPAAEALKARAFTTASLR